MTVAALKAALRKCTRAATWSAGQRAFEAGRVALRTAEDDGSEYVFAVTIGPSTAEVTLWPEDADWEVEPEPPTRGSPHAVAAMLALEKGVDSIAQAEAAPQLVVVLTTEGDRFGIRAEVDRGGEREIVRWPLPGGLTAEPQLLHLLRTSNSWPGASVPPRVHRMLLQGLREADAVELDGAPIKVSQKPLDQVAVVDQFGPSYRLQLEDDPSTERVYPGEPTLLLARGILQPRGYGRLDKLERHRLSKPVLYGPHEVGVLTTRRLPELERYIKVVRRQGVPETREAGLNLRLDLLPIPGGMEVMPRLVYGDPPIAEVLPQGCIPLAGLEQLPARDRNRERQLTEQLVRELGLRPGGRRQLQGSDAARFVRDRLPRFTGAVRGDDVVERFSVRGSLTPSPTWRNGRLDLQFQLGDSLVGGARVLRAWKEGDELVALPGGGYAPLPTDWIAEHAEAASLFLEAGGEGSLPRHLAGVAASLAPEVPPDVAALVDLLKASGGVPERPAPESLVADLRDYQAVGWSWLAAMQEQELGCVLADDMGLGKTLQALTLLLDPSSRPALVVAPRSVLRNWQSEAARFAPELRVGLLHGPRRGRRLEAMKAGELDVLVTTYAVLRLDIDALKAVRFGTVILDEAQAIKNADSQTAKAARSLRAQHRVALTGTPVENHLGELWSLFEFLNPGFFGGRRRFEESLGGPATAGDARAVQALRRRVAPFVLRRLKGEVAKELPPRTDIVLRCPMSPAQKDGYERVRTGGVAALEAKPDRRPRRMRVLEILTRLRQASCHAGLLPGGSADTASGKLDVLCETLDEVIDEGHRALVFSQWTSLLDLVEPRLLDLGIDFLRLDGSTRNRAELVDRFQAEDGPPVFLISLKAGGTGLNLTAADHVFHLDPWWNPAVEQQATDRAHRIGQERPVIAWKLVSEGTVEERIVALQERKRALAESVLDGQGVTALTDADLDALLEPLES